jgi:hypothetical protein
MIKLNHLGHKHKQTDTNHCYNFQKGVSLKPGGQTSCSSTKDRRFCSPHVTKTRSAQAGLASRPLKREGWTAKQNEFWPNECSEFLHHIPNLQVSKISTLFHSGIGRTRETKCGRNFTHQIRWFVSDVACRQ